MFPLGLVLSLLLGTIDLASAEVAKPSADLRVMSFNIRYGTANDGENRWENRRDFLIDTIKAFDPDLLGTQETLAFQRDFIAEKLTGYEVLGVGRNDGRESGEMMALYFRRSRFEKIDGGHFWLSETPEQAGSKSWDSSLPRMVTWVKLRDRLYRNSKPIVYFNTHFDHRGPIARLESARLIRTRIAELRDCCRVIVTGDFNTGEGSEPYAALFGELDKKQSLVVDTYRIVHAKKAAEEGSFSNFARGPFDGPRIDWIAASRDWQVLSASIDRTERDGRFPSDHFPVTAVLRIRAAK
jgi:endonuclease/exonuclease/phosphatase family metal-dependent hydrolase